jgi:hypothetical protein
MMTWKKALVTNDDDGVLVLLLIVSMRQPDRSESNILFNKEDPLLKIGIAEPLQLLLLLLLLFQYGPHVKNQKRLTVRWVKFFPFFSRVVLLCLFTVVETRESRVKRTSTVRLSLRVWDKHTRYKQFTSANLSRPNCVVSVAYLFLRIPMDVGRGQKRETTGTMEA